MARPGVSLEDIAAAADALLDAGERPTAERIRGQLGRGSPNTIGPLLDRWWATVGARLRQQQAKLALPDAPAAVAALATQLWEQALAAAQSQAQTALAEQRTTLDVARAELAEQEAGWRQQVHDHARLADHARQLLGAAEQRLADLQQLLDQQAGQLADLAAQRTALQDRVALLETDNATLQLRAAEQAAAVAAERQRHSEHLRAVEDRAHGEVDRARQELKELRRHLDTVQRDRQQQDAQARQREEALRDAVAQAQRDASAERARAETLASQFERQAKAPATRGATKPARARRAPRAT